MHCPLVLLCFFVLVPVTIATTGFDLSYFQGDVPESSFQCLAENGYVFGVIEATHGSEAELNPYIASVMANAKKYIPNVDVYIFPDPNYDASSLISGYITDLINNGALTTNMVWFDIEGPQYWSTSCSTNQNWLKEAVDTVNNMYKGCGLSSCVGIYSGESQWSPIMCNTSEFSNYPLWYAHYDNNPSFSDFEPFGGWNQPSIKQYEGTTYMCGTAIDEDWY